MARLTGWRRREEWTNFCDAPDRDTKLAVYKTMRNRANKTAAHRILFGPNAAQKRETAARQRAINATTQAEIDRHCQLTGIGEL